MPNKNIRRLSALIGGLVITLHSLSTLTFANDAQFAGPLTGGTPTSSDSHQPEVPLIYRNVTGIIDDQYTRSHVPPVRPTKDGRLGVNSQISSDGVPLILMNPEKMDQAILHSQSGAQVISEDKPYIVSNDILQAPLGFQHGTLCEPNSSFPERRQNPYSCGDNGAQDCYDVVFVGGESLTRDLSELLGLQNEGSPPDSNQDVLYSIPMTITVDNPKTANAIISHVEVDDSQIKRAEKPYQSSTFEHITPGDGRLMIMRAGNQTLTWFNENSGKYEQGHYDTVYSVSGGDAEPCDIMEWTHLYPLSHAPYHDIVKNRYDFAAFPFRDPMGHIIRDGAEFKGTYPWMDSKAKNITMTVLPTPDLYQSNGSRYDTRCVVDGCDESALKDAPNQHQGFVIMGSWTQGKAILLDGVLNDIDFELAQADERHSYAKLYQAGTGITGSETGEVRLGSTREVGNEFAPIGTSKNTTIFDSIEARFNYQPEFMPITPKDVVWIASSGRNTDEFAFDDYLNPNAFIISNMVGAVNFNEGTHVLGRYYDGWNKQQQAFVDPVYVQNSSTALRDRWLVPNVGQVHNGRLEPTALGGIRGKGIWLNGEDTFVEYDIASQPRRIDAYPWFVGLFIDRRADQTVLPAVAEQALISFPDGSELTLVGDRTVNFRNTEGSVVNTITLPAIIENQQWHHLAMNIHADGKKVRFYQNGFPIQEWVADDNAEPIFQFSEGSLLLGKSLNDQVAPFKGWVDEFKVYADNSTMESVCNHAHGTLIALEDGYSGDLANLSAQYNGAQNGYVSRELKMKGQETFNRYQCYTDNSQDYGINPRALPEQTVGLGHKLNFPEGPLLHDAPRPDSSFNQFCLTCHTDKGGPGLTVDALRLNENVFAKDDPRRQPLQPDAAIYGNIPANWLSGSPNHHQQLGQAGALIDEWLLESSAGKSAQVKGFTLVNSETGEDILPLENGMTLNLSDLRTSQLNIRAVTNGLTRQVEFTHNGIDSVENQIPFALFGTHNDRFNAGTLTAGIHTLSAQADDSQLGLQFTVTGSNNRIETGSGAVLVDLDDGNPILDWIVGTAQQVMQLLANLFNSFLQLLPDSLLNFFFDLFGLENPNDANSLFIMVDSAIRDGHTVTLSGRVSGDHTGILAINQESVPIQNNQYVFHKTTNTDEFTLVLIHQNGDHEETTILFDKDRVVNGAQVRLNGEEGIYGYLNEKLEDASPLIEGLVKGAFSDTPVLNEDVLGINFNYTIKSVTVNDISSDIYPGQQVSNDLTIDGAINIAQVDLDSRFSAVGWCFDYPSLHWYWWGVRTEWHNFCPVNFHIDPIAVGLDELEVPLSVSIVPGSEADFPNQLLALENIDVSMNFDKVRITIGWIPEWLIGIFINPLKELIFPHVEPLVAAGISELATGFIEPNLALIPDGINIGRAARFHEATKAFPLPDAVLPLVYVLTGGIGMEFSVDHMKTQSDFNQIGLDIGVYSLTSDDQVHYGYRAADDTTTPVTIEEMDVQKDIQFLLQEATMNKALATLAQENTLSAQLPVELNQLLQMDNVIDEVNNGLDVLNQFDFLNLWPDIQFPHFDDIEAVLAVDLPSAPYVSLPEDDEVTARIIIDNIHFTVQTSEALLNEYVEDQVTTLLDLNADLILDIRYSMVDGEWQTNITVERANLVSLNAAGVNIPEDMVKHLLSRLAQTILPQVTRQLTFADTLPPVFDLDRIDIQAIRPNAERNDLLIEFDMYQSQP